MVKPMYAIYDSVSCVYDRPFPAMNDQDAIRSFTSVAMNKDTVIGQHPEHFKLFRIGKWNDAEGKLFGEGPHHIASAHEIVSKVVALESDTAVGGTA